MAIKRKGFNTKAILTKIYPKVEESMNKNLSSWKRCMSSFISKRTQYLFDQLPCDRIFYKDEDRDELCDALKLNRKELSADLKDAYFMSIEKFNTSQIKDITTVIIICIVRYFALKKDKKNLELAMIYQAFSGKFYPSIHKGSFPIAPAKYRHVMEYVVNNMMNLRYDLKTTGNVINSIKSLNSTWINSYPQIMKNFEDEDVVYLVQQLHTRIKAFVKNIASLYYEAYENKEYINYQKDDLGDGEGNGFHLTNNDSFKLQKYVENAMTRINTSQIDYKICRACADNNVKKDEIASIIETILNNKENLHKIKEYITNIVATYLRDSEDKEVVSLAFLNYTIKAKPNTKDPALIRIKELTSEFLDDNSVGYRKRKKRNDTKNSYHKALLTYFAIIIINSNK